MSCRKKKEIDLTGDAAVSRYGKVKLLNTFIVYVQMELTVKL